MNWPKVQCRKCESFLASPRSSDECLTYWEDRTNAELAELPPTPPPEPVSLEEKFIRKLERRKAKEAFVKQGKPWKEEQIRQRAANWFRHTDALLERLDRNC